MPELRQLRAFVAVAEELNFTRAAERLFLAQQAVSRQVAQLESELGVELLERTTHTVSLTPAGESLLADGREVLLAADAAFAQAQAVAQGLTGTLRIGVSPAVGTQVRAETVRVLRENAPEVSVAFHEVRPGELAQVLRDRVVEAALVRTAPDLPELDEAALRPTPAALYVPVGHRLAGGRAVRLAELDGERLLTWSRTGTPYTDLLVSRLAAAGARVEPVQSRVTGGADAPALDDSGAVALMPEGWPAGEEAVQVPLAEPVDLPLLLLWPAGVSSAVVQRLRDGLSSSARSALPYQ